MTVINNGRVDCSTLPSSPLRRSVIRRLFILLGNLLFTIGMGGLAVVAVVSLALVIQGSVGRSELPMPFWASPQDSAVLNPTSTPPVIAAFATITSTVPTATLTPYATPTTVKAMEAFGEIRVQGVGTATPTQSPTPRPSTPTAIPTKTSTPRPSPTAEPRLPITGLRINSIDLETKVVPAKFIDGSGGGNWEVPAFMAGHADHTAGAGAQGNAVLLGHIDSIRSGDVFHALPHVSMGDIIEIWSENRRFQYRVAAIWSVPRGDSTVVQPTPTRSISLITCTGQWLPLERDYSHRLVVRADLVR